MLVTAIYGTNHKGSTYHIAQAFLNELHVSPTDLSEFFLPRDMDEFCVGCGNCFMKGDENCPHYEKLRPIRDAIERAELLIFVSPVYVYHATGQMKTFFDHFGFQWMVHRPNGAMFSKKALIISTAAGGGMKSTMKDIKDSLDFWGIGQVFTYGKAVQAINWQQVREKIKTSIDRDVRKISRKIRCKTGRNSPRLKVKLLFYMCRIMQKKMNFNPIDHDYWEKQGWLGAKRPWHKGCI